MLRVWIHLLLVLLIGSSSPICCCRAMALLGGSCGPERSEAMVLADAAVACGGGCCRTGPATADRDDEDGGDRGPVPDCAECPACHVDVAGPRGELDATSLAAIAAAFALVEQEGRSIDACAAPDEVDQCAPERSDPPSLRANRCALRWHCALVE
jgi:hypothetical protein